MKLGVAHLTALELPPELYIPAARRAGFDSIGLRAHQTAPGTPFYPLPAGSAALQSVRRQLADEGIVLHDLEFVAIVPEIQPADVRPLLESAAELGAVSITVSGDDPDWPRLVATFAAICELARPLGVRIDLEFMRWRAVASLADARAVIAAAGQPNGTILLDVLHFFRSGGALQELTELPPGLVGTVHLCDAPLAAPATTEAIIAEARGARLLPGDGELPLAVVLRALAKAPVDLSVELPMPRTTADERLSRSAAATRKLLSAVFGNG